MSDCKGMNDTYEIHNGTIIVGGHALPLSESVETTITASNGTHVTTVKGYGQLYNSDVAMSSFLVEAANFYALHLLEVNKA